MEGRLSDLPLLKEDPIFGLSVLFKEDSRPDKVDLAVGVYRTVSGKVPLMSCVQQVLEARVFEGRGYLPIDGDPDYVQEAAKLVFDSPPRFFGAQTLGSTGALRLSGRLLKTAGIDKIWIPNPTWANHRAIFSGAGVEIGFYDYYTKANQSIAFDQMCQTLKEASGAVLFHTSCHNPTATDLTQEQWKEVFSIVQERSLYPIFDCAYQGLGDGLDADVWPIRYFAKMGMELMVCYSFSKNLGLYAQRCGCLFVITDAVDRVGSQVRSFARCEYSNPPAFGASVVRGVLESPELVEEWKHELDLMRERCKGMRNALMAGLHAKGGSARFPLYGTTKRSFCYVRLRGWAGGKIDP